MKLVCVCVTHVCNLLMIGPVDVSCASDGIPEHAGRHGAARITDDVSAYYIDGHSKTNAPFI